MMCWKPWMGRKFVPVVGISCDVRMNEGQVFVRDVMRRENGTVRFRMVGLMCGYL